MKDIDYQKYLSDSLVELIGVDVFFEFAKPYVVESQEIEGMVYTFINVLSESIYSGSPDINGLQAGELGIRILNAWIEKYPQNQRLINKQNKFESLISNY